MFIFITSEKTTQEKYKRNMKQRIQTTNGNEWTVARNLIFRGTPWTPHVNEESFFVYSKGCKLFPWC